MIEEDDIEKEYNENKPSVLNNVFHKMYTFKNANRDTHLLKPEYRMRFHIDQFIPLEILDQLKPYYKNFKDVIETKHAYNRRVSRGTLPFKKFLLHNMTNNDVDWKAVMKNKKTSLYGNVSEQIKSKIRFVEATYNPIIDEWQLLKVGMRMNNAMYHEKINNNKGHKEKEIEMIDLMYIVKNIENIRGQKNNKLMVITSWPIDTIEKKHDYTYEKSYHFGSEDESLNFENRIKRQYKLSLSKATIKPSIHKNYEKANINNNKPKKKRDVKNNRKRKPLEPYKREKYSSYDC